jgi:FKBP-type peptidyl-prolyl cis-trans isomerase SlyD
MKISNQCVATIHYTLTDDEGAQLDSSHGKEPLAYLHGRGNLVPGLEQELEGRQAGDTFQATVEPGSAYGDIDSRLIQDVPRTALAEIQNLQVGMRLQSQTEDGQVHSLTVDAIGEDVVTLNANHPLAGVTLHFDVTVESVRAATEEEIEHGHVHPH